MFYNLSMMPQIKRIMKKNLLNQNYEWNNKYYTDIKDGEIYQNLLNSDEKISFQNNCAYSLTLNSDGISVCEKSNLSIWPVYLVINEMPIEHRFKIENLIIAGKLKFSLYL